MKQPTKVLLCCLLLLTMLLPLAACGDAKGGPTTTAPTTTASPDESQPSETEKTISSGLPAMDYGEDGAPGEFVIGTLKYNGIYNDIDCVEEYGESINDSKVKRNRAVEEKYNIKIINQMNQTAQSALATDVSKSVQSGTHTFDLVLNSSVYTFNTALSGDIYQVNVLPHINPEQPWWREQSLTDTSIYGKNFFIIGDLNLMTYTQTPTMLFNKQMVDDFSLEDPYTLVREGKWTFEKMMELGAGVVADLDGDGMGEFDRYALTCNAYASDCYALGADRVFVAKDAEEDAPYVNLDDELFLNYWEMVVTYLNSGDVQYGEHYTADNGRQRVPQATFSSGRSLFWVESMGWVDTLREMEIDFGLLPMPKADESQAEYTNSVHSNATCVSLPITADDEMLDRNCRIIEDLCCESMRFVRPAYYENALEGRYFRDAESGEMLDLILLNVRYDLMLVMPNTVDVKDQLRATIMQNNTNLQGISASNKRSWDIMLKRAVKALSDAD